MLHYAFRTAIRNQLRSHADAVKQARQSLGWYTGRHACSGGNAAGSAPTRKGPSREMLRFFLEQPRSTEGAHQIDPPHEAPKEFW
jgi:hypothetical protein